MSEESEGVQDGQTTDTYSRATEPIGLGSPRLGALIRAEGGRLVPTPPSPSSSQQIAVAELIETLTTMRRDLDRLAGEVGDHPLTRRLQLALLDVRGNRLLAVLAYARALEQELAAPTQASTFIARAMACDRLRGPF